MAIKKITFDHSMFVHTLTLARFCPCQIVLIFDIFYRFALRTLRELKLLIYLSESGVSENVRLSEEI